MRDLAGLAVPWSGAPAASDTVTDDQHLESRVIRRLWLPLAATWLMMAAEGPFVAALIARLTDPEVNLAAFGVALSIGMLVEAPVIMMMSAATALVTDRRAYAGLRRFAFGLNLAVTIVILAILVPPVFDLLAIGVIGLPESVARLTALGVAALVPWPAAIGFRRFYQGILIRHGATRRVAYGTVVRLAGMAATGVLLAAGGAVPGVVVGTAALSAGVTLEAVATRWMAAAAVRAVRERVEGTESAELTFPAIVRFYLPLAVTSLLTLGAHPLVTLFVGRSRLALESLAVLPVLNSLVFLHRSPGLAFQEVVIALLGSTRDAYRSLRRFAGGLGLACSGVLAAVAFTPLAGVWFERVSGLSPELSALALGPVRILALMPAFEVLLSLRRGVLVHTRATRRVTAATAIEVGVLLAVLAVAAGPLSMIGVVAAASGIVAGRVAALAFLHGAAAGMPASARKAE
ncbi:MAG: hypothetical protein AB1625_15460 [Acidobacteriota bacterium]